LYGAEFSCRLLSSFARLFTYFLQLHGFTLGVRDILVSEAADKERKDILSNIHKVGFEAATRAVGLSSDGSTEGEEKEVDPAEVKRRLARAHFSGSAVMRKIIDGEYKAKTGKITSDINTACLPHGLLQPFPENNLTLMIQSGAKGSSVNSMQISCLLGNPH
jgi:DNA-directed RNA polymerase I subunit RPA1